MHRSQAFNPRDMWAQLQEGNVMITGSCHCGNVKFEISSEIQGFKHCHCHTCRKIHGTVYGSSAVTSRDGFRIVSGSDSIKEYESSPGKKRCFCATCGSHVYAYRDDKPSFVIIRLGTLDGDQGIRATHHIWMSQKASWYEVVDDLPKHEKL